ncbi:hypothetical protein NE237_019742 [Protea cynaroides]|uniref:Uncharacterized protein n=1 Tax=Protea cynaroides TaxID=273540 RepID=A0A9Q0H997_9MAGN|nr:hypothetical protein NE237_019742 [Protea cynaroides]
MMRMVVENGRSRHHPAEKKQKQMTTGRPGEGKRKSAARKANRMTAKEKLLKEFSCLIVGVEECYERPSCSNEILDFLQNPQVNRDVMEMKKVMVLRSMLPRTCGDKTNGVEEASDGVERFLMLLLVRLRENINGVVSKRRLIMMGIVHLQGDVGRRTRGRKASAVADEGN